jgi:hypothetical protein
MSDPTYPPGGTPPGPPQFIPPPPRKSRTGKIIALVVGGVLLLGAVCVVVVVLVAVNLLGDRVQNAAVGDCLPAAALDPAFANDSSVKKVDCASDQADTRVVGIVPDTTQAEYEASTQGELCAAFPTTEAVLWIGAEGGGGKLFCLEPVRR